MSLLSQHREFLLARLEDVNQCAAGTPELGAITGTVATVSRLVDKRLAESGIDVPRFTGEANRSDFEEARRVISARLAAVDAALSGLAS